jgi:hypothetical protein
MSTNASVLATQQTWFAKTLADFEINDLAAVLRQDSESTELQFLTMLRPAMPSPQVPA